MNAKTLSTHLKIIYNKNNKALLFWKKNGHKFSILKTQFWFVKSKAQFWKCIWCILINNQSNNFNFHKQTEIFLKVEIKRKMNINCLKKVRNSNLLSLFLKATSFLIFICSQTILIKIMDSMDNLYWHWQQQ
jgi:hypothetical protein